MLMTLHLDSDETKEAVRMFLESKGHKNVPTDDTLEVKANTDVLELVASYTI